MKPWILEKSLRSIPQFLTMLSARQRWGARPGDFSLPFLNEMNHHVGGSPTDREDLEASC